MTADSGTPTPDAKLPDSGGGGADAGTTPPTHSGTIAVHEVSLLDAPTAGKGGQINISFSPTGTPSKASFSRPGALPCSATLTDKTVPAQNPANTDEGPVMVAISKSGGGAGSSVPPCAFVNGTYRCISAMGAGGALAGPAGPTPPGVFAFTPSPAATFAATMTGSYLIETTTGRAMPIVGASGTQLGIQGGTGAAAGPVASWIVAAGIGPVALTANPDGSSPGGPPEFLNDTDTVKVTLVGKTGGHFDAKSTGDIQVGDEFELDDATTTLLATKLNLNTTANITFGCKTTGSKACAASTGLNGTLVVIDSTDATTFPGGLTDLGTAVRYTGSLICAELSPTVTVPKEAFAVLAQGNPTKLRITVFRDFLDPSLVNANAPKNGINVVAGHGLVKFQLLTP